MSFITAGARSLSGMLKSKRFLKSFTALGLNLRKREKTDKKKKRKTKKKKNKKKQKKTGKKQEKKQNKRNISHNVITVKN